MAKNLINSDDIEVEVTGNNLQLELSQEIHNKLNALGDYVIDSMAGNEQNKAPSVNSVKNYINGMNDVISCSLGTTGNYSNGNIIPLNTVVSKGNKLTSSDGKVKIGAGVSKVLISAAVYINYSATNNKVYGFSITKSGMTGAFLSTRIHKTLGEPIFISCASKLVEVQENDEIYMTFVTNSSASPIVETSTYMTIEVIE